MSTEFSLELCAGYVHVQHPPGYEITPEGMARFWPALIGFCKQHHCYRVLAEGTSMSRRMSALDAYDSGVAASMGKIPLRVALCVPGYVPDEETALFEDVAANRGVSFRVFANRDEALRWLCVT